MDWSRPTDVKRLDSTFTGTRMERPIARTAGRSLVSEHRDSTLRAESGSFGGDKLSAPKLRVGPDWEAFVVKPFLGTTGAVGLVRRMLPAPVSLHCTDVDGEFPAMGGRKPVIDQLAIHLELVHDGAWLDEGHA